MSGKANGQKLPLTTRIANAIGDHPVASVVGGGVAAVAVASGAYAILEHFASEPLADTTAHELVIELHPDAKNFDIEYHEDGISTMTFEVNGKLCQSKVREVVTGQAGGKSSRKLTDVFPIDAPIEIDCSR